MIDLSLKLSEHFTLEEGTITEHRNIPNIPSDDILEAMKKFAHEILEHTRELIGPMRVNSFYRCIELNKIIGGSIDSAHTYGVACDFMPLSIRIDTAFNILSKSSVDYDQLIDEHAGQRYWLHIGGLRPDHVEKYPRKQLWVYVNGNYSRIN